VRFARFPALLVSIPLLLSGGPLIFPRDVVSSASYLSPASPGGRSHKAPFFRYSANGDLYVIDPSSYQIVATVAVGSYPVSVTVDPTGTEAYVCNRLSTFISDIDLTTNQSIENIQMGFSPETAVLVP